MLKKRIDNHSHLYSNDCQPPENAMYVCICNAVTDREIRRAAAQGARSLDDLRDTLGVASCCGCCHQQAEELLAEAGDSTTTQVGWFNAGVPSMA
jgi:bacterioferritin-associated ferredoxin